MATISKKQLCKMYGITYPTLKKRLLMVPGLEIRKNDRLIYPIDLKKIYAVFGDPPAVT